MAFAQTPVAGIDVTNTIPATAITSGAQTVPFAIGTTCVGNDGKTYVFAKANASISASTAICTVNASTFLATASGGSVVDIEPRMTDTLQIGGVPKAIKKIEAVPAAGPAARFNLFVAS